MKIVNCRNQVIPLPIGGALKPYESRIIPDDDWMITSRDRMTTAFINAGVISVMPEPTDKPAPTPVKVRSDADTPKAAPKQTWRERFKIAPEDEAGNGDLHR